MRSAQTIITAALCDYLARTHAPLDVCLPLGDRLRELLGDRYDRFDSLYGQIVGNSRNPIPALTSLALLRLSAV